MKKLFLTLLISLNFLGCNDTKIIFSGQIGENIFRPESSGFAYKKNDSFILFFSWLSFDVKRALNTINPFELEKLKKEFIDREHLFLLISKTDCLSPYRRYETNDKLFVNVFLKSQTEPTKPNSASINFSKIEENYLEGSGNFYINKNKISFSFKIPIIDKDIGEENLKTFFDF